MRKSTRLSKRSLPEDAHDVLNNKTRTNAKIYRPTGQNMNLLNDDTDDVPPSTETNRANDAQLTPTPSQECPLRSPTDSHETVTEPSVLTPPMSAGEELRVQSSTTARVGLNLSERRRLKDVYRTPGI